MIKEIYKYGELFSGPGGLALGAVKTKIKKGNKTVSIEHKWANDYDEDSCSTYRRNIAQDHPESVIAADIRKLNIEENTSPIDIFAYGFPCNDFSIVGKQKGFHGEFGPLYSYGVKVLDLYKPIAFVAENVSGIRSANNGNAFTKILQDLQDAENGYEITVNLYKAEEYGVPQTRHRMIIVGIDKETGKKFKVPKPTTINNPVTAKQALENPPINKNAPNHTFTRQTKKVTRRLENIKPGQNAWNADLPDELKLNVKGAKMSQIYRRLHPDKPSYTITGSGGGGTHGYHYSEPRALTNRERARIQTFPDNFIFEGSKESVRKQIGMAVPVKLSEVIFEALLKTLSDIDYESIEPNYTFE
ncbi:DNA (cytosine-5-)-methyltransferase [Candidatus Dojkabacteria bacterium]|nr:DNA (cytosine-5-)-methyltransferase [Candidatus Dojkabacteria bacterium]